MNYPVIAEFIIEFIQYADEADIRSFLEFLLHDKNLFSSEAHRTASITLLFV